MQFDSPRDRPRREHIVPMINVVFLLLIFFLMTAEIAPPVPFEVTPPAAGGQVAAGDDGVLYVAADGRLAFGALRGEAVFGALAGRDGAGPLVVRADAALPAGRLAALLPRLTAAGVDRIELVTAQ